MKEYFIYLPQNDRHFSFKENLFVFEGYQDSHYNSARIAFKTYDDLSKDEKFLIYCFVSGDILWQLKFREKKMEIILLKMLRSIECFNSGELEEMQNITNEIESKYFVEFDDEVKSKIHKIKIERKIS